MRFLKIATRIVPVAIVALLVPRVAVLYVVCGLIDVLRNEDFSLAALNHYFLGNGAFTWLLAPCSTNTGKWQDDV